MGKTHSTYRVRSLKLLTIMFFFLSIDPRFAHATELPNQYVAQQYIDNLLLSYNSLVKFHEVPKPYFEDYTQYFSLYREEGYSYQVIFVKAEQNDTKHINLIFVPIRSETAIVIIDFDHVLNDYFPGLGTIKGTRITIKGGLFEYLDTILYANFLIALYSEEISNNTLVNSKNLAEYVFGMDTNRIRIDRIEAVWEPFVEENREIISGNWKLSRLESDIRHKILWNETYTYDLFLNEHNQFRTLVIHHKELPIMQRKYQEYISSIKVSIFSRIDAETRGRIVEIESKITSDESYLLEDLETEIEELDGTIDDKLRVISLFGVVVGVIGLCLKFKDYLKPIIDYLGSKWKSLLQASFLGMGDGENSHQ